MNTTWSLLTLLTSSHTQAPHPTTIHPCFPPRNEFRLLGAHNVPETVATGSFLPSSPPEPPCPAWLLSLMTQSFCLYVSVSPKSLLWLIYLLEIFFIILKDEGAVPSVN